MSKKSKKKTRRTSTRKRRPEAASTSLGPALGRDAARPKALKPAEIQAMRASMNASQALFARLLNVSSNAVESWEQGIRQPRQATLKLLHIARKNPSALLN